MLGDVVVAYSSAPNLLSPHAPYSSRGAEVMSRLSRWTISAKAYLAAANDYDYCADESVVPASTRLSSSSSTILSSSSTATLVEEKEEEEEVIFPGFAMYQMAIAYYCQGQHSLALDTTTDILSYQKKKLVSLNNPNHNNDDGSGNYTKSTTLTIETAGTTTTTTSSNFAKDLHNAVMPHVNSPRWMDKKEKKQQNHHPMQSNTIAVMISNYPTHHGVVKTLLLRGQILAATACGGTAMDDSSLILQAVCSIEMAVAIQRKIIAVATPLCTTTTTTNDQLLVMVDALILLGIMKCQLRQYNESLIVYREAFDILNDIRIQQQATKPDQLEVELGNKEEKKNDNSEIDVAADDNYHNAMIHHYQQAIMITHQIARSFYLQGKVYHRQYKFIEAFHYYNKSLNLLLQLQKKKKLNNKSLRTQNDTSNSGFSIKTITKCTKSKYAFEKLTSAYWDDNCVI
jgi:tetratricopeptide (TPR) repeat protein